MRLREAEDGLRLACRVDRGGRAPLRVRPAAAQCGASSAGDAAPLRASSWPAARAVPRARRAGSSRRSPPPAAHGGTGSSRVLVGDEDAVLHGRAERLAHVALGHSTMARSSGYPTSRPAAAARRSTFWVRGRAGRRAAAAGRAVPPAAPCSARPRRREALRRRRGCLRSGRRWCRSPRRAGGAVRAASSAVSSPRASGPSSSTRPEPERRTPSASLRMRPAEEGSSPAVGREQYHGSFARLWARNTTRSSVEVSAQCRSSSTSSTGAAAALTGEERERLLEDPQLGACGGVCGPWPADERMPSNRAQRLGERLVGQLGADEIDRPAEQGPEARLAGAAASSAASRVLPMPASPATRMAAPRPCPRGGERPLELPEFACAPHQRRSARASTRPVSRGCPSGKGARKHPLAGRYGSPAAQDKALRPTRSGAAGDDHQSRARRTRGGRK